jgi:3-oxoadipate enol-lactonase
MPRWFTDSFRAREPQTIEHFRSMVASSSRDGYLACCAALRDEDLREAIAGVRCPVLCVAGTSDPATPPDALKFIHDRIAGSRLLTLDAAHLTNVEQQEAFNDAVSSFLRS